MTDITFNFVLPQDPSEIWLPIPSFEGFYEVSSMGRVRTLTKSKVHEAGYIFKLKPHKSGYVYAKLVGYNGKRKSHLVHCLMMQAFNPTPSSTKVEVNHIDGIKHRNVLSNLEWLTHQANILHARDVLKVWADNRGEKSGNAKLTDDDVREIRCLWADGMQQKAIAPMFSVSQVRISQIVNRKAWSHIE